jgi:hypothetical protein
MTVVFASAILWASFAVAGTVVELTTESSSAGGDATLYVDKDQLRIDSNEKGKQYSVIYKIGGEDGMVYWIIDHEDKSYTEITEADMAKIQNQVEESMKAVKKRLPTMPPSKRAEVEKAYNQQLAIMGRGEHIFQYEEVSRGVDIGGWATTQYAGRVGEDKLEDVWAATWQELDAPGDDFKVMTHMAEVFSSAGQKMPAFFQFGRIRGSEAFPIMVVTYQNGTETERSEVKSVSQKKLEASLFELPKGLSRKEITEPTRM